MFVTLTTKTDSDLSYLNNNRKQQIFLRVCATRLSGVVKKLPRQQIPLPSYGERRGCVLCTPLVYHLCGRSQELYENSLKAKNIRFDWLRKFGTFTGPRPNSRGMFRPRSPLPYAKCSLVLLAHSLMKQHLCFVCRKMNKLIGSPVVWVAEWRCWSCNL